MSQCPSHWQRKTKNEYTAPGLDHAKRHRLESKCSIGSSAVHKEHAVVMSMPFAAAHGRLSQALTYVNLESKARPRHARSAAHAIHNPFTGCDTGLCTPTVPRHADRLQLRPHPRQRVGLPSPSSYMEGVDMHSAPYEAVPLRTKLIGMRNYSPKFSAASTKPESATAGRGRSTLLRRCHRSRRRAARARRRPCTHGPFVLTSTSTGLPRRQSIIGRCGAQRVVPPLNARHEPRWRFAEVVGLGCEGADAMRAVSAFVPSKGGWSLGLAAIPHCKAQKS
ncbi:hypothetical protein GGX14DRAFT_388609 [Mycena pura]|uniref:Uncharacterized protein n=1 Tax=Mycena pura TaxID=153505 RepID=A0AAD6YI26_9AGAR|nr:hypothetical protein GGX14DRAFT_388609 [Mycena pura]